MGRFFLLRRGTLVVCALLLSPYLGAQDLGLSVEDLRIELRADGGYHLFIRSRGDISSVLITESTRDPALRSENYAYRAAEKNDINGNEIRLLDGYPIPSERKIYSLVSSTPVWHPSLGWAYHIYIPHVLLYGYEGGRHGEVQVGDGTYLNIRAFYYAYADYRGPFRDNPFMLRVSQETQRAAPEGTYLEETVVAFSEIAGENVVYSQGPSDLVDHIGDILKKEKDKNIDIVICIDATGSMKPYIDAVRAELIPMVRGIIGDFASFRIGMVLYRDYNDEYLNRVIPFTKDFAVFQRNLNAVRVGGGRDIPEAVYEALYAGATKLPWEAESKIMILIGDAPPHPQPRGNITKQMVDREVLRREIRVHAIILPQ